MGDVLWGPGSAIHLPRGLGQVTSPEGAFPPNEIAPVITKVLTIPTTFLCLPAKIHVKEK